MDAGSNIQQRDCSTNTHEQRAKKQTIELKVYNITATNKK